MLQPRSHQYTSLHSWMAGANCAGNIYIVCHIEVYTLPCSIQWSPQTKLKARWWAWSGQGLQKHQKFKLHPIPHIALSVLKACKADMPCVCWLCQLHVTHTLDFGYQALLPCRCWIRKAGWGLGRGYREIPTENIMGSHLAKLWCLQHMDCNH